MYRNVDQLRAIGVMGFGVMGSTIAQCLAEYGYDVFVTEPSEDMVAAGWEAISRTQELMRETGDITADAGEAALKRIVVVGSVEEFASAVGHPILKAALRQ